MQKQSLNTLAPKPSMEEKAVLILCVLFDLLSLKSCFQMQGNFGMTTSVETDIGDPVHLND